MGVFDRLKAAAGSVIPVKNDLDMEGSQRVKNLPQPAADGDAARKQEVDAIEPPVDSVNGQTGDVTIDTAAGADVVRDINQTTSTDTGNLDSGETATVEDPLPPLLPDFAEIPGDVSGSRTVEVTYDGNLTDGPNVTIVIGGETVYDQVMSRNETVSFDVAPSQSGKDTSVTPDKNIIPFTVKYISDLEVALGRVA